MLLTTCYQNRKLPSSIGQYCLVLSEVNGDFLGVSYIEISISFIPDGSCGFWLKRSKVNQGFEMENMENLTNIHSWKHTDWCFGVEMSGHDNSIAPICAQRFNWRAQLENNGVPRFWPCRPWHPLESSDPICSKLRRFNVGQTTYIVMVSSLSHSCKTTLCESAKLWNISKSYPIHP